VDECGAKPRQFAHKPACYGEDGTTKLQWAISKVPDAFASVAANIKYIKKVTGTLSGGSGSSGKGLDLVLAIDTTGSMSPYINSVVRSASSVVDALASGGHVVPGGARGLQGQRQLRRLRRAARSWVLRGQGHDHLRHQPATGQGERRV
jgi:hypothetical protein